MQFVEGVPWKNWYSTLKPQQRMGVLCQYLLPRLKHALILGQVSAKILLRLDCAVRVAVRQWFKLPHDIVTEQDNTRCPTFDDDEEVAGVQTVGAQ